MLFLHLQMIYLQNLVLMYLIFEFDPMEGIQWIGLRNYLRLFTDSDFW